MNNHRQAFDPALRSGRAVRRGLVDEPVAKRGKVVACHDAACKSGPTAPMVACKTVSALLIGIRRCVVGAD